MKILYLTYYFKPDLCAGSFRNTPLVEALIKQLGEDDFLHVVTTVPNRYGSYNVEGRSEEKGHNFQINRIDVPLHASGMIEQAKSFVSYYRGTMKLVRGEQYDLVFASSSRLFTAFLGKRCAAKMHCPLYLDIRDIFVDTMTDIFKRRKFIQKLAAAMLGTIEWYTFRKANHINLISGGFRPYFKKYPFPTYSEFTNGIDDEMIEAGKALTESLPSKPFIITYAGNIGVGQGLEKILPEAAQRLGTDYQFKIIGDGGTRKLLEVKLKELNVQNVELINPMARAELIKYYQESTFLFFHLNDLEAFKKVMPSKMFEYGAFDKPIIAGIGGFAAAFVKEYIPNHILFKPTDVNDFVDKLKSYQLRFERREQFIEKFSRSTIDRQMADCIVKLCRAKNV